jgi:hypothetical protein
VHGLDQAGAGDRALAGVGYRRKLYLDHAGHKARTVQALRVQRRTLYARLARIERILGRDLGTQDTRTRLTLAIQALDLLQDRDSGVRTVRASRSQGWA